MNILYQLLPPALSLTLAWTLIHFLWQGFALGLLSQALLRSLHHRPASTRYTAACLTMALMLVAPVVTFMALSVFGNMTDANHQSAPIPAEVADSTIVHDGTSSIPWFSALVWIWMLGSTALVARLMGGWMLASRLRRIDTQPLGQPWTDRVEHLCLRLDVHTPIELLESFSAQVPMVIGWLRPAILIPTATLAGLTVEQIDHILAHELAHIRRHDYLVNLIQCLAEAVLFYHPAVWWVSARIRAERENCCDDLAVAAAGNPRSLAQALGFLAEQSAATPPLAFAADGGSVLERIQRLSGTPTGGPGKPGLPLWWSIPLIAVAIGATVLGFKYSAPRLYIAEARMIIPSSESVANSQPGGLEYLAQTEAERMQSTTVLGEVVKALGLEKRWGMGSSKNHELLPLAVEKLREHMSVKHIANSPLVTISVGSTNAMEAAEIANGIINSYRDHRALNDDREYREKQRSLENEIERVSMRFIEFHEKASAVAAKYGDSRPSAELMVLQDEAAAEKDRLTVLRREADAARLASLTRQPLQILDPAMPPLKPRRWQF